MFTRRYLVLAITSTMFLFAPHSSRAAAPPHTITISVQGMHCAGCAAKVTRKLEAVSGIDKAQVEAETGTAVVSAKADATPSPRALWEAVDKAGYKPTKLIGPTGTFTAKPKS